MECTQAVEYAQDASSLVEETGDSDDGVEATTSLCHYYEDDDRESSNDFVCNNFEGDEEDEDGDTENYEEKKMTWEMWLQMEKFTRKKVETDDDSISNSNINGEDDGEENRLFWETCLASGY